jgi:DNA-binding NarL/FixJ family response regulator
MRIVLALQQKLFRDALAHYLQVAGPEADIVEACNQEGVLCAAAQAPAPDLILLDAELPGLDGLKGLEAMRQIAPNSRIALLADKRTRSEAQAALAQGAVGILSKDLSGRVMLKAPERIRAGVRYVPAGFLPASRQAAGIEFTRPSRAHEAPCGIALPLSQLTRREREVLRFLIEGLSNREIAERLAIKDITVSFHLKGLFRKLKAMNRTQAAITAMRLGWQG